MSEAADKMPKEGTTEISNAEYLKQQDIGGVISKGMAVTFQA